MFAVCCWHNKNAIKTVIRNLQTLLKFNIENFEIPESRERGAYCWLLQGGTQVRKNNSQFLFTRKKLQILILKGKHVTEHMIRIASD